MPIAFEVANVMLSVALVATFVSLFFFTYVAEVEQQIVQLQMSRIVTDLLTPVKLMMSPSQIGTIKERLKTVTLPDTSAQDAQVEATNKTLRNRAFGIFFGSTGGIILLLGILRFFVYYDLTRLVVRNLLAIAFVAGTYFLFVTFVVRNFYLIDSNYVRYVVLENVLKRQAQIKS